MTKRHGKKVNRKTTGDVISSRGTCKGKHDTWILSQIRELSETSALVMSAVKDKPEQMVEDSGQRTSDGKNILKCCTMCSIK